LIPIEWTYKVEPNSYINSWSYSQNIYNANIKVVSWWSSWCLRTKSVNNTNYWYINWSLISATTDISSYEFSSIWNMLWDSSWSRWSIVWRKQ
jgi:hypothetical protein